MTTLLHRSEGVKFSEWLSQELHARKMKPQDLANAGDIDPATVSAILNERREVGPDVARRIAKGLELEQWEVFYAAGMLTEIPKMFGKVSATEVSIAKEVHKADSADQQLLYAMVRTLTQYLPPRNGHKPEG